MNKPEETQESASSKRYARQIDQAFDEASKLAGSSLAPTEFYERFLNRTLSAIEAPAGVVWLRTPQGFLQVACQVNLDQIGLDSKRGGRQCHNEILRQVFQSQPPRPVMIEPQGRLTGIAPPDPNGVPAANLTDYYALFAPIVNQERQPFGLLEVFQDPALDPRIYQTLLQYTTQMAGYASQYHQFTGARQNAGLEKIYSQVETFAKLVHSSLDPTEVAYHIANEGRRLVECDRMCVAVRHGKKSTVEAVSGADVVEKAGTHVKRMKALFDAVIAFGDKLIYKGTKDEGLPQDLSTALDDYLAESQPKLLVVMPIRDDREKDNGKPARAALLMELFNPPENVEPMMQKLELVSKHSVGALYNAAEMERVPFGFIWRPIAFVQEGLGGKNRFYFYLGAIAALLILALMILVPSPLKMEAKGDLLPQATVQLYPATDGEVLKIHHNPGDMIKPGATMVSLYSPSLRERYSKAADELTQAEDLAGRYLAMQTRGGMNTKEEQDIIREIAKQKAIALSRREYLDQMAKMYNLVRNRPGEFVALAPEVADKNLARGADTWRVLSGDRRDELTRRTVRPNEPLLRLGLVDGPWRVELKIPQRNIGHVSQAFAEERKHKIDRDGKKYLDVDLLVGSRPDVSYPGRLYQEDMAGEAIPNKDDHNESEPIMLAYVRVDVADFPEDAKIPQELRAAGVEVRTRIKCGNHALGYSLFHGVWEWFYEKVIFFF